MPMHNYPRCVLINTTGIMLLKRVNCISQSWRTVELTCQACRGQLKRDGTRTETRFSLSAKRTSPFKSAGGRQFSWLLAAELCASAVVMLDTPCSEVVWRVLGTHSIRQFPLHFPFLASPYAITFQFESTFDTFLNYSYWGDVFLCCTASQPSLVNVRRYVIH